MEPSATPPIDIPPRPVGPLVDRLGPTLAGVLGRACEPIYRAAIGRINRRYDRGTGVTRLPVPVISVGNLSVGGTGKTPMVVRLTRALIERGRSPCIAMRGYAKPKGGDGPRASDEEDEYHRFLPGVPVVAQPDRIAGIRVLLAPEASPRVDCVVLDDGFQHRRLARDVDIVLIDASRDPFRDRLLPAGWLRENVESLRRAHAVVITHAELVTKEDVQRIVASVASVTAAVRPIPIGVASHVWDSIRIEDESWEVSRLRGARVVAVCAIGNPAGFLAGARASGADIAEAIVLPDHDPYGPGTMERLSRSIERHTPDLILTTEKDWSKLRQKEPRRAWAKGRSVARPSLRMEVESGWDEITSRVRAACSL